ncbi:MAG: TauD/TfdA family dioxygenase [Chloroflexota bacterium]
MSRLESVERLPGNFGVEVKGVDVPNLSDSELQELLHTLYENRVLVLRTSGLTKDEYVKFARRVGDPIYLRANPDDYPEISIITNVNKDTASEKRGAAHWHTDQSFKEEISSATMLYSVQAPDSALYPKMGETLFCNMAAAYEALPNETKDRIEDLVVEHRHGISVAARPGDHTPIPPKGWNQSTTVYHPLVKAHPITGQKTLYAISGTSQGIVGMEQDEAKELLNELGNHAFQEQFITSHAHSTHDLVLWDNPTTMHSATPIRAATGPQDTRLIHRISVRGMPSVFSQ